MFLLNMVMFVRTSFTFTLMMTGAFSRNVGKLFSELKLVTDNLLLHSFAESLGMRLVFQLVHDIHQYILHI